MTVAALEKGDRRRRRLRDIMVANMMLALVLHLMLVVGGGYARDLHFIELMAGKPIYTIEYDELTNDFYAYTDKEKILITSQGKPYVVGTIEEKNKVTSIAKHTRFGEVTVNYFTRCVTVTRPNGLVKRVGSCGGHWENITPAAIYPHAATFTQDGKVVFTDEYNDRLMVWDVESDSLSPFTDYDLVRPKGIVYSEHSGKFYVTISNGVFITDMTNKSGEVVGVADEWETGLVDGEVNGTVRFSNPTAIVEIKPEVFAMADYSNNRVRVVDMVKGVVSSLCSTSGCELLTPTSLAVNKFGTELLVGTPNRLYKIVASNKRNLCYGRDQSGVESIKIGGRVIQVWCDLDTPEGPWITLLTRYDGSESFDRNYNSYVDGFGDLHGEHWIGLENIHLLTSANTASLRIDVEAFLPPKGKNKTAYALYTNFKIGNSSSQYTLEDIIGYSGSAGDMEAVDNQFTVGGPHQGLKFSTKDQDEDKTTDNCAAEYHGGWWFRSCYMACLTCGPYSNPPLVGYGRAMAYLPFTERKVGLKSSSMKVKLPEDSYVIYP